MLPCAVLQGLRTDLNELVKTSSVPFEKNYKLGAGAELELAVKELEKADSFQITVKSSSGLLETEIDGYRRIPALLVGLTSQRVTEYLVDRHLEQCDSMEHEGADEILALYNCIRNFQMSPEIPFSYKAKTPSREYEIFAVKLDGNRIRLELMTNHIYGESIKTIAEVDSEALIADHVYELLGRMLGEWIRPESVKSIKVVLSDLDRSNTGKE